MTSRLPLRRRSCRTRRQRLPARPRGRRRGDAFDPGQNPNARGCRRPSAAVSFRFPQAHRSALTGDAARATRSIWRTPAVRVTRRELCRHLRLETRAASAALTTLPPSATPRDEFDLGIGYMQRKDYALAEETMRNFVQNYPSDPLVAELAVLARREFFPAPAIPRRRGSLPRRDHQVRQIGESPPTPCCGWDNRWRP